ncbi:MAG: hypothetical protein IPL46_00010 [Saprospiraceae bacterium]|nr:hypothetical protein [Saprospiraceae bacterium]
MKVNKEETFRYAGSFGKFPFRDHDADWKLWKAQIQHIHDAAASVDGVKPEIHVPEIAQPCAIAQD